LKRSLLVLGAAVLILGGAIALRRHLGSREEAGGTARDARMERIRSFWELYNQAAAARMRGDFESAALGYQKALELDPEHQDSLFYLAVSLEESGRYDEAARLLEKLTDLYPEHNPAWSQLGMVLSTLAPGAQPDLEAASAAFKRSRRSIASSLGPSSLRESSRSTAAASIERARPSPSRPEAERPKGSSSPDWPDI